ncbi:MAG: DUF2750 domain-containing protein [Flavobacterium sp.]|nr:MAG: DUF2750 domain-containing protein [Flavobacterium sp.]
MSQSASQASIFYRDVEKNKRVWTIKDQGGYPMPKTRTGVRSVPFWSSKSRAELIIKNVEAYNGFHPVELNIEEFYNWLKILSRDKQLAGINWSGADAVGYDMQPERLMEWVEVFMPRPSFWDRLFNKRA